MVCMHTGCPHPRILDAILTHGDLRGWNSFLTWWYREKDNG